MCRNTYFIGFFEEQPKFAKKCPPQNDNFSQFAKHRFITKKTFVATPLLPKIGVFQLGFFETKNIDVEQKHNLKPGKSKDKKQGFENKKRQETKEK